MQHIRRMDVLESTEGLVEEGLEVGVREGLGRSDLNEMKRKRRKGDSEWKGSCLRVGLEACIEDVRGEVRERTIACRSASMSSS